MHGAPTWRGLGQVNVRSLTPHKQRDYFQDLNPRSQGSLTVAPRLTLKKRHVTNAKFYIYFRLLFHSLSPTSVTR